MATLVISRRREYGGLLRTMRVRVGSHEVGLRARRETRVEVPAGAHEVRCAMDWARSPTLHVTLGEDDVLHLHTRVGYNPVTAIVHPRNSIRLDVDRAACRAAGTPDHVVATVRRVVEPRRRRHLVVAVAAILAGALVLGVARFAVGLLVGQA